MQGGVLTTANELSFPAGDSHGRMRMHFIACPMRVPPRCIALVGEIRLLAGGGGGAPGARPESERHLPSCTLLGSVLRGGNAPHFLYLYYEGT
jgi:hypothetical protein